MDYGLYTAFLGMRARQRTLETISNNIANASTTGFKADRLSYSVVEAKNKGSGERSDLLAGVATGGRADLSAGAIQQTGRSLDVAVEGDAFMQIQTPRGVRYTRAGSLSIDAAGQLVTKNGDIVTGERGPITVPRGELTIGEDGTLATEGSVVDKIKLVRFENPAGALLKEGDSLFMSTGAEGVKEAANFRVVQGALESSNVNTLTEMVAMLNNNREFESLQKSMSLMMNDIGKKIAGEIGRI